MAGDLDITKLASDFLEARIDSLVDGAQSVFKGARIAVRKRLDSTYRKYLLRILERYSKTKSFFIRSQPLPLYEFFVPLDLVTDRRSLNKPGAATIAAVARSSLLTGSGGCGKTMLMRHLLISAIRTAQKVPVFVELRSLNQTEESVRLLVLKTLQDNGLDVDDAYLEAALSAGHLCLLLDGFDEIELRHRKRIAAEIRRLSERYHKNWMVLSSRPDQQLQGWTDFTQFAVKPLDLERAVELVRKLPFEDPIRDKFLQDLEAGLFQRHHSFLSNPLLLLIMLLTYSDNANIPSKLSIFYQQAYESLFQKHDALKGGYQRDRRSGLDIQDFAKVFEVFCLLSYDKRLFSFSRTEALGFIDRSEPLSGVSVPTEAFLDDTIQAVCLLVEEGLAITFAHRSFQEYFVARFISSSAPESRGQLVRRFAPSVQRDNVLNLLYEMDPYSVERYYLLPGLEKLREHLKVKRRVGVTHFLRYLRRQIESFQLTDPKAEMGFTVTTRDEELYHLLRFVRRTSGEEFPLWPEEALRAFRKSLESAMNEAGVVEPRTLRADSEVVRYLYDSPNYWGGQQLQMALDTEFEIRKRHQTAEMSLEDILKKR